MQDAHLSFPNIYFYLHKCALVGFAQKVLTEVETKED